MCFQCPPLYAVNTRDFAHRQQRGTTGTNRKLAQVQQKVVARKRAHMGPAAVANQPEVLIQVPAAHVPVTPPDLPTAAKSGISTSRRKRTANTAPAKVELKRLAQELCVRDLRDRLTSDFHDLLSLRTFAAQTARPTPYLQRVRDLLHEFRRVLAPPTYNVLNDAVRACSTLEKLVDLLNRWVNHFDETFAADLRREQGADGPGVPSL